MASGKLWQFRRLTEHGNLNIVSAPIGLLGGLVSAVHSATTQDVFSATLVIGVFVIFLWCLYTAGRATTGKINDRAWGFIKIISGFFIGNLVCVFT
jgi:hypothetical protein